MAYNETVNININANTSDAEAQTAKLENNIKTLDGAINLVGGSIEVLAGSLALSGAVTEEQAERFQTAAVGAIALADGSKRIIEGYKTLATETDILTKAQRVYNTVLKANPIGLLVTVLAAATVAVVAFANAQNRGKTAAEKSADAYDEERIALEKLNSEQKLAQGLASARGDSQEDLLELAVQQSKEQEEVLLQTLLAQRAINQFSEETKKARAALTEQQNQTLIAETRLATFRTDAAKKAAEDAEKERLANTKFSEEKLDLKKKEIDFNVEVADSGLKLVSATQAQAATLVQIEKVKSDKIRAINQAEQAYKEALLTEGIDNLQGALGALFGENKAVAKANVLIDAAQAGVGIIKNSQTTGPFAIAYQATQFALLTATTLASLKQIDSAEPGSTGTLNTPGGGGGRPNASFGIGTSTIGGATGTLQSPTLSSAPPVRAYVLTGDVRDGLEAESVLNTRRQFP